MSRDRETRMEAIRTLITQGEIENQAQLLETLKEKGFSVNQSTVSRDISAMQLHRRRLADGRNIYVLPQYERAYAVFKDLVQNIEQAQNIVVVKTLPGNAHGVAAVIDQMLMEELVGSVAGDDTILLVSRDKREAGKMHKRLTDWWKNE